ncbi:hypothetical protein C1645_132792 [Glomus cerebriforme]|uniref:Uncharacterized protein n=1 Tax=Glomus cerebriforme TaxID=658196 RepID=A0A397T4M1_9GLOM|nr:hypothetical protein C1645_132792 [Glomus cerebriforme]
MQRRNLCHLIYISRYPIQDTFNTFLTLKSLIPFVFLFVHSALMASQTNVPICLPVIRFLTDIRHPAVIRMTDILTDRISRMADNNGFNPKLSVSIKCFITIIPGFLTVILRYPTDSLMINGLRGSDDGYPRIGTLLKYHFTSSAAH